MGRVGETFLIGVLVAIVLVAGCTASTSTATPDTEHETIIVNVAKQDPGSADYWEKTPINLWNKPGGWEADDQKIVGTMPSSEDIEVPILDIEESGGRTFYKIRYQGQEGWATKYLLTGDE